LGLFLSETLERFVDGDQAVIGGCRGEVELVELDALAITAVFLATFVASVFDEDAAHGFGGGGEKVAAVLPALWLFNVNQPQIGFVNERSGLQCVPGVFIGHARTGEPSQLVIDDWQQLGRGFRVAIANGHQYLCHIGHADMITQRLSVFGDRLSAGGDRP
jgi:hypothetical protein